MGVWRPVLQITTPSVIKKRRFSTPVVIGPDHIHLHLRAWLLKVVLCLRTHFLVQVKSTFVKVFFCYLMVSWFPWKTYLISGQYETQQINLVISTNLVANDGVKLLGFDQLATLKRQFFPFRAVANLSSRSFASYSGKGKALGMSLVRGPKPA